MTVTLDAIASDSTIPTKMQVAHDTFNEMPGLNPKYFSMGGSIEPICSFSLEPSCRFNTYDEAMLFGKELQKLCVPNLATINPLNSTAVYVEKDESNHRYKASLMLASTDNSYQLSSGAQMRVRNCVSLIHKNESKIAALLNNNGIDTACFSGFSKEYAG